MKTFRGFLVAVRLRGSANEIILYGPEKSNPSGVQLLRMNGLCLFPVRSTAEAAARQLEARFGTNLLKVVVGAATIRLASSDADLESLRPSENLFVVQHGEEERVLFGRRVGGPGSFDGRQEARYNGLTPFQNFADAEHAAGEICRQCACPATIACAVFSWF